MTYYGVFVPNNQKVFEDYAETEQEALDLYAAYRSGYGTLSEMARSATFRDLTDVTAYPIKR